MLFLIELMQVNNNLGSLIRRSLTTVNAPKVFAALLFSICLMPIYVLMGTPYDPSISTFSMAYIGKTV